MITATSREERTAKLRVLVARQMARIYWLNTEAGNLSAYLSEEEILLVQLHLAGMSYENIGNALQLTRERIRQKVAQALKKLEPLRAGHPIPGIDE